MGRNDETRTKLVGQQSWAPLHLFRVTVTVTITVRMHLQCCQPTTAGGEKLIQQGCKEGRPAWLTINPSEKEKKFLVDAVTRKK